MDDKLIEIGNDSSLLDGRHLYKKKNTQYSIYSQVSENSAKSVSCRTVHLRQLANDQEVTNFSATHDDIRQPYVV